MRTVRNMQELRDMPYGVIRQMMEYRAFICHEGDEDIIGDMEDDFNGSIGGYWYVFEEGDNPRSFIIEDDCIDLLSDEWNWCECADFKDGCFFVFWSANNAGGPCLFVPNEPWVPDELRTRLKEFVAREDAI